MDCALKSKQESAQGAWAWWSMGFTEAYKHFSSSEHKSLKQKLRDKAGEVAEGDCGVPGQPCG